MTMHVNWWLEALTHRAGLSADGGLHRSSLLLIGSFAHRAQSVRRAVRGTGTPNGMATTNLALLVNRSHRACAKPHPLRNHTNREPDNHNAR